MKRVSPPVFSDVRSKKRSKAPLAIAAFAFAIAAFGVASTIFLWKFPDVWNAATTRPTAVFRVQSRSMEPSFRGPRFVWNCPECGETFATSLDVGAATGGDFFNVRRSTFDATPKSDPLDGISKLEIENDSENDASAAENTNADSPEVRRFRETARFFVCPRCGFDRVPASNAVFQDGALVEFTSRFATSESENNKNDAGNPREKSDGFLAKTRQIWRRAVAANRSTNGPQRWDVVIFRDPNGRATLKRIVGLPGETVEIRNGDVFIDGKIARRSLDETFATSTRIDSLDVRRGESRLSFVRVAPIWSDEPIPEREKNSNFPQTKFVPTAISNESPIPRWNGIDVAPIEPARDFLTQFTWSAPDALPVRFAVLARRPTRVFLLEYDENSRRISLRSIPLIDSKSPRGKTFEQLNEIDFLDAPPRRIVFESTVKSDRKRAIFRVFLVDGQLVLTRDGDELARFSTDDVNSTETAAISEPFAILGDVARVGAATLRRDLHYSSLTDSARRAATAQIHQNQYFLLGDNSPASLDSRFETFGTVDERDVVFRVTRQKPIFDDF